MKKVVITGATGSIGLALIDELIKNNIEILVLCRRDSSRNSKIPVNPLIKKEECDLNEYRTYVPAQNDYDVFFHLAWAGTTGKAREDMFLQNLNIEYSLDAVQLADRFGCKRFVGVGSQAEYGRTDEKLSPSTPVFPETGYGIAKLSAGLMTRKLAHQLKMEHLWVRVLSIYGPNDSESSMVVSVINKLKKCEIPRLTKGEQLWDYLYCKDAANAFRLIAEKGIDGKIYVLGSGKSFPLRNYLLTIQELVNKNVPLGFGEIPYANNQVMSLCADISSIKNDTGWTPKIDFKNGILDILSLL